jgi:TupA-like ATPgrasp
LLGAGLGSQALPVPGLQTCWRRELSAAAFLSAYRSTDLRRLLYSPAWQKLDVTFEYDELPGDVPRPVHLAEMIAAAEALGKDLDFVRADFYDTAARLYFGELTTAPEGGGGRIRPIEFDRYLGALWKLPARP